MSPSRIRLRIARNCRRKMRLTMEEAARRLQWGTKDSRGVCEIYVCPNCQFLHLGHKAVWAA
jgi:hypothetical protein